MLRAPLAALALLPALALAQGAPTAPRPGAPAAEPAAPAAPAAAASRSRAAALAAEVDGLWPRRDAPGVMAEVKAKLSEAEAAAPGDGEVLWRQARLYFWLADDPGLPSEEKSRLGKLGWEYGDRATAALPGRVEAWDYAAAGVGNYALGIGVITALRQGIEGKFKERLTRAEQLDPDFEHGAIQTAWGRFWYELPWPKYDPRRSRQALEAALAKNPANVRARVYLADLHRKEDRAAEAQSQLTQALASPPGKYDPPEERRWQEVARRRLEER